MRALAWVLLLLPRLSHAISIKAELDRSVVSLDDQFTLSFRLPRSCSYVTIPLPASDAYQVVSKDFQSADARGLSKLGHDQWINKTVGQTEGRQVFVLKPLLVGMIEFEPMALRCGDGELRTFAARIRVVPGKAPPGRGPGAPAAEPEDILKKRAAIAGRAAGEALIQGTAVDPSVKKEGRERSYEWREAEGDLVEPIKLSFLGYKREVSPLRALAVVLLAVAVIFLIDRLLSIWKEKRDLASRPSIELRKDEPPSRR